MGFYECINVRPSLLDILPQLLVESANRYLGSSINCKSYRWIIDSRDGKAQANVWNETLKIRSKLYRLPTPSMNLRQKTCPEGPEPCRSQLPNIKKMNGPNAPVLIPHRTARFPRPSSWRVGPVNKCPFMNLIALLSPLRLSAYLPNRDKVGARVSLGARTATRRQGSLQFTITAGACGGRSLYATKGPPRDPAGQRLAAGRSDVANSLRGIETLGQTGNTPL